MINRFIGMFSTDMGIDLGTCNTLICTKGRGIVISEPSVVAVKKGTNKVLLNGEAVGTRAKEMLGKTHGSIDAIRPLKDGVISNFDITHSMLRYFIRKVHQRKWGVKPQLVVAVPSGITTVEKNAVIEGGRNMEVAVIIFRGKDALMKSKKDRKDFKLLDYVVVN